MAMFSKRNPPPPPPAAGGDAGFIGAKLAVTGKLSGGGSMVLMGRFEGEIDLSGELTIAPSAAVKAEVKAVAVVVSGRLAGNVTASERIHLEKSAAVDGRLKARRISIADGARLNGEVEMPPENPAAPESGGAKAKKKPEAPDGQILLR
jgi:cytoskeletal protein CcmA (bactofilin family)